MYYAAQLRVHVIVNSQAIATCGYDITYPCGKVRRNIMKMHRLLRITRVFLHMISTDTVKKFYVATLHDMLRRYTGVQFTVINS